MALKLKPQTLEASKKCIKRCYVGAVEMLSYTHVELHTRSFTQIDYLSFTDSLYYPGVLFHHLLVTETSFTESEFSIQLQQNMLCTRMTDDYQIRNEVETTNGAN